jgi:hypothetical protein
MHKFNGRGVASRNSMGRVAMCAALAAAMAGCGQRSDAGGAVTVAAASLTAPPAGASVLGFESTAGWTVSSGTVSLSKTTLTQGTAALAVAAPVNYTTLVSAPLASGLTALAGLTSPGATVEVDMLLPTSQPNPFYLGALQLYVSAPSHGVYSQYLGQSELTGQELGTFQTYQFAVTDFVRQQLAGATVSDLSFTLALNAPAGAQGTYVFDNLRTTSPATAQVGSGPSVDLLASLATSPPANTPGLATFTAGTIQIPASLHVKLGDAGKGSALFELGFGATTSVSCTYAASPDTTAYLFSSCSKGNVAGDIVAANFARLTIKAADPAQPLTKVKAQLAYDVLGDQVGTKLVPPIPTFWGGTLAEINAISQAFTQLQIDNPPPVQRFVALPIPDFAKRQGDGSPVNALNGSTPRPPNDPPFDFKGDLNNSPDGSPTGQFDAFYELAGSVSGNETNQHFTSHFDASGTVGVVVLGTPVKVLQVTTTVDSDNGGTNALGSVDPTTTATFDAFVFGNQIESDTSTQQTGFTFGKSISQSFETPPIPIWIFSIQGGVTATAGVQFTGALAANGFQMTLTPQASVSANIEGGVNIGVASGGVNVTVQLIDVTIPTVAQTTFNVSSDPNVCAATLNASVNGSVQLSSGGGSVSLVANIGPCPFCYSDSWNIFSWSGLNLGSVPFPSPFPVQVTSQVFKLPASTCNLPLTVAIAQPAAGASLFAGIGVPTLASANRPSTSGQLVGDQIDCQFITWKSSDPQATFSPSATGCSPLVTFSPGAAGTTQTLTASATDQFGETGTASVTVSVVPPPAGPVPTIIAPLDGSLNTGGVSLQGTVSGGTGTVTAVWTLDAGAILDTQTVAAGSSVALTPVAESLGLTGDHTITLTVTDSTDASNSTSVSVHTDIVK